MQEFQDSKGNVYAYEDDVTIITASDGTTKGTAPDGSTLSAVPTDLTPYTPPKPTTAKRLSDAKQAKKAEIQAFANAAMAAPISFTNAAGTQATFPMHESAQLKYLAAYTRYVVHGKSLPSGFSLMDTQGNPVTMTVADIDNLSTPVFNQIETVEQKAAGLYSQINAVTTSTSKPIQTVQAVVWS